MIDCPECDGRLVNDRCDRCGWEIVREPVKQLPPAYREPAPRKYVRSVDTDRCTEPGCTMTVAEHRAEFRQHMARIVSRMGG